MRNIELAIGEIYHICNRSVDGKNIFRDDAHVTYFLENIFAGNTTADLVHHWHRDFKETALPEEPLVEIFCCTLMPSHFHIGMRQLVDGGIAKLMHRVCNGFAKYFNVRHERKGRLFMGPYTAVHITSDVQAAHLLTYIHANPLDLTFPQWREGRVRHWQRAKRFLEQYRYSSLPLYLGMDVFHPLLGKIITKDFARRYYQKPKDHMNAIRIWSAERGYEHVF